MAKGVGRLVSSRGGRNPGAGFQRVSPGVYRQTATPPQRPAAPVAQVQGAGQLPPPQVQGQGQMPMNINFPQIGQPANYGVSNGQYQPMPRPTFGGGAGTMFNPKQGGQGDIQFAGGSGTFNESAPAQQPYWRRG